MSDLKRVRWWQWVILAVYGAVFIVELMAMNSAAAVGFLIALLWYALYISKEWEVEDLKAKYEPEPTSDHEHV